MASTSTFGFVYEVEGEEPGHSLRAGGDSGADILAEQVEDELVRVDSSVADHESRLGTIEDNGLASWVQVDSGSEPSAATFVISGIPTGVYRAVRLTLMGNAGSASEPIRIRFNGDNTSELHRSGCIVRNANNDLVTSAFPGFNLGTFWHIGQWGGGVSCTAEITIFGTHLTEHCSFMGRAMRIGGTGESMTESVSWGRLESARLLDSLRVSGPSGSTIAASWWLEGAPA